MRSVKDIRNDVASARFQADSMNGRNASVPHRNPSQNHPLTAMDHNAQNENLTGQASFMGGTQTGTNATFRRMATNMMGVANPSSANPSSVNLPNLKPGGGDEF